jgi:hypothetical protein
VDPGLLVLPRRRHPRGLAEILLADPLHATGLVDDPVVAGDHRQSPLSNPCCGNLGHRQSRVTWETHAEGFVLDRVGVLPDLRLENAG